MVRHTIDRFGDAIDRPDDSANIFGQPAFQFVVYEWLAALCAENDMVEQIGEFGGRKAPAARSGLGFGLDALSTGSRPRLPSVAAPRLNFKTNHTIPEGSEMKQIDP
jgi:hypothetical protein